MQTKEITVALGIKRERIKYYIKEGVFDPENVVVNGKREFTDRDFENLKRLVILTKSGLSCSDIKKVQTGAKSLQEVICSRQNSICEEIERMTGTLALSIELFTDNVQYNSMPIEDYWQIIMLREQAGEKFMDIKDIYSSISLHRDAQCPYCGKFVGVDLEEYEYAQSSDENEMGQDIVRYFDSEDNYKCVKCGHTFQIEGWIREYPVGAYDSEKINISKWEEK